MSDTRLIRHRRPARSARALVALAGAAALLTGGVAVAQGAHRDTAKHHHAGKHHHAAKRTNSGGTGGKGRLSRVS